MVLEIHKNTTSIGLNVFIFCEQKKIEYYNKWHFFVTKPFLYSTILPKRDFIVHNLKYCNTVHGFRIFIQENLGIHKHVSPVFAQVLKKQANVWEHSSHYFIKPSVSLLKLRHLNYLAYQSFDFECTR